MHELPFSEACERNKGPILDVLQRWLADARGVVLEVGAGTGQHAVYFASALSHLAWQPTDRAESLRTLATRIEREGPANLLPPLELDVTRAPWPTVPGGYDAVFSANTLHIMSWPAVEAFCASACAALGAAGRLIVYGPFRYRGAHTSPSNAGFDRALRTRDPASGVRDFEAVDALVQAAGLQLVEDVAMPANNRTLVWQRPR